MLCFGVFERRKLKSLIKTNAEVNATGVVYTPGVCRGYLCPHAHFSGASFTYQRGYSVFACFIREGFRRPEHRNEQMKIPRFSYAVTKKK